MEEKDRRKWKRSLKKISREIIDHRRRMMTKEIGEEKEDSWYVVKENIEGEKGKEFRWEERWGEREKYRKR